MTSLRTRVLLVAPAATLALALTPAVAASAHDGVGDQGRTLIAAPFTPSQPTDAPIFGVHAGAAPWVLDEGTVHVHADGGFRVALDGLQILRAGGTTDNPIASIVASLFCGGTLAARTAPQPMSVPDGDAEFHTTLTVPSTCDGATVLISPAANTGLYIASARMAGADED